jgi:hypothetical protein
MRRDEMSVIEEIAAERERQKTVEGWTPEHDDTHKNGEMAVAAACYATVAGWAEGVRESNAILGRPPFWPFETSWWKPTTSRRDLIKAAALIVAEVERLDRAESAQIERLREIALTWHLE